MLSEIFLYSRNEAHLARVSIFVHLVTDHIFIYPFILYRLFYFIPFYFIYYLLSTISIFLLLFSIYFMIICPVPGCSGMFRDVSGCSGMFHVPGFVDALTTKPYTEQNFESASLSKNRSCKPRPPQQSKIAQSMCKRLSFMFR